MTGLGRMASLFLAAACAACGGDQDVSGPGVPDAREFTTLAVTPARADLYTLAPGNTITLAYVAQDQGGNPMTVSSVSFTSDNTAVAAVTPSGMVSAGQPGTATITTSLTAGSVTKSAQTSVTVVARAASIVGVVTDESNGLPVPGAVVAVGGLSTTAAQDGGFQLSDIPVTAASLTITVTVPGFDAYLKTMLLQQGPNELAVRLFRNNTIHEIDRLLLYVPPEVTAIRGVMFVIFGQTADVRPMLRYDFDYYGAFPLSGNAAAYREHVMAFARTHGFAVMGSRYDNPLENSPVAFAAILDALVTFSSRSGHPELANAPLLLHGHSLGACVAHDFAALHPKRVIGFISAKAGTCYFEDATAARTVPAYFFTGEFDTQINPAPIWAEFTRHRANDALWAMAVEPDAGHGQVADQALLFSWLAAVVALRLPDTVTPGAPVELRPVLPSSGWLGDPGSKAIAPHTCYAGERLQAPWLPTERTAREWQALVSERRVTTITTCAP